MFYEQRKCIVKNVRRKSLILGYGLTDVLKGSRQLDG